MKPQGQPRTLAASAIFLFAAVAMAMLPLLAHCQSRTTVPEMSRPQAPVKADDEFLDALANYQICQAYLDELESRTGSTNLVVPIVRVIRQCSRDQAVLNRYVAAHKLIGWNYDFATEEFTPPKPAKNP